MPLMKIAFSLFLLLAPGAAIAKIGPSSSFSSGPFNNLLSGSQRYPSRQVLESNQFCRDLIGVKAYYPGFSNAKGQFGLCPNKGVLAAFDRDSAYTAFRFNVYDSDNKLVARLRVPAWRTNTEEFHFASQAEEVARLAVAEQLTLQVQYDALYGSVVAVTIKSED